MTALDEPRPCPDPIDLASFLEGNVTDDVRRTIGHHVEHCDRCLFAIRETSRYEREQAEVTSRMRLLPLAAGILIVILSATVVMTVIRSPERRLQAAMQVDGLREFEGRLAAFNYTRYQSPRSSAPDNASVAAAAEAVLARTAWPKSAHDWHARGLAFLLKRRPEDAVRALSEATRLSPRSTAWRSDLAAARIAMATDQEDPDELRRALADVSHVLQVEPSSVSALFNRAVAYERLGDTPAAIHAWSAYLAVDSGSPWADEARWRMKKLRP